MLYRHNQEDELSLAASCIEPEYVIRQKVYACPSENNVPRVFSKRVLNPRTKHERIHRHREASKLTNRFTRQHVVRMALDYYTHRTGMTKADYLKSQGITRPNSFEKLMRAYDIQVNRFYSIDGGQLYKMLSHRSLRNWQQDGTDRFLVNHRDRCIGGGLIRHYSRDRIVEICHVHHSHCFDSTRELNGLLERAGISRSRYYQLRREYGVTVSIFVQVDGGEILPVHK